MTNNNRNEFEYKKVNNNNNTYKKNNKLNCDSTKCDREYQYKIELVWVRIIILALIHLVALSGFYLLYSEKTFLKFLMIFTYWIGVGTLSSIGITAGCHRLWTHRTYKAKLPLRIFLMICQTMAHQNSILEWSRDHRVHHKFTDTNADPHNSRRGFFFSHIGWLLCKKHPEVREKGKTIDMSDIASDPVVQFQEKYFYILMPLIAFVLPAVIPYYFMEQTLLKAFIGSITRYVLTLNFTWSINSVAHLWGHRPYDNTVNPCDNWFVIATTIGEGYHNYHHVFPWDYKCAEHPTMFNSTTYLLNGLAKIGQAYDMKTVSDDMIRKRVLRTGDGTHHLSQKEKKISELVKELRCNEPSEMMWGWDDLDMAEEDLKGAVIVNKKD